MKNTGMGKEILSTLAAEETASAIQIEDFAVNGLSAKVRLRIVASATLSRADILKDLNSKFKGALRAVPRSFRLVDQSSADSLGVIAQVVGYVVPNVQVINASEAAGKMTEVASNMFMDEAENVWNQTGGMLYKKSGIETSDSLSEMLAECASEGAPASRQRKGQEFETITAVAGDFVNYMSKGEMAQGFVVAASEDGETLVVLATNEEESETIPRFAVQSSVLVKHEELSAPQEAEIAGGSISMGQLIQYYKRLYQYNLPYFAQLEARIKSYNFL